MIKVYIASAYTVGDIAVNVKRQMDVADALMTAGFAPFTPLYSHFQHMAHPRPYQDWIKLDKEWVKVCDAVLRLESESKGADGEVELAKSLGKPIFYGSSGDDPWDAIEGIADYYREIILIDSMESYERRKTIENIIKDSNRIHSSGVKPGNYFIADPCAIDSICKWTDMSYEEAVNAIKKYFEPV